MKKTKLSIIIVNYNSIDFTKQLLFSLENNYLEEFKNGKYEVLITDNNSTDNSALLLENYKNKTKIKYFKILKNKKNLGFSVGNNLAIKKAEGEYILIINPDTIVYPKTISFLLDFMDEHQDVGASTCQINIPSGGIDEASHRGFPTPWNAFCHFSGLEKLFPKIKFLTGYTRSWEDLTKIHKVPAIVGAFMLVRKKTGDKINWFDEDYFFYGEDLDFCYKLGKAGFSLYYVPDVAILHFGGVSSGIKKQSQKITTANLQTKILIQNARFNAMKIFYRKHYLDKYPKILTWLIFKGIDSLKNQFLSKLNI